MPCSKGLVWAASLALRSVLPKELVHKVVGNVAAMRLQSFYRRRTNRYRRQKKWHHMECLIVRHAGDMSLSLLRSVARVRLEWQFEMDSWVTMLEAPNAQAVLATILQEICNGVWSVRTTSKAC